MLQEEHTAKGKEYALALTLQFALAGDGGPACVFAHAACDV